MSLHAQYCGYQANPFGVPIRWFLVLGDGPDFSEASRFLISRPGDCDHLTDTISLEEDPAVYHSPKEGVQVLVAAAGYLCRYVEPQRFDWFAAATGSAPNGASVTIGFIQRALFECLSGGVAIDSICRQANGSTELDILSLLPRDVLERKLY
jgi:hypothetical protein